MGVQKARVVEFMDRGVNFPAQTGKVGPETIVKKVSKSLHQMMWYGIASHTLFHTDLILPRIGMESQCTDLVFDVQYPRIIFRLK